MSQTPPQEKEALEYLFRAVNEHKHLMATFTLATRYNEVQSLLFFISLSFSPLSPFNSSLCGQGRGVPLNRGKAFQLFLETAQRGMSCVCRYIFSMRCLFVFFVRLLNF
jgi:hypothetical protein